MLGRGRLGWWGSYAWCCPEASHEVATLILVSRPPHQTSHFDAGWQSHDVCKADNKRATGSGRVQHRVILYGARWCGNVRCKRKKAAGTARPEAVAVVTWVGGSQLFYGGGRSHPFSWKVKVWNRMVARNRQTYPASLGRVLSKLPCAAGR